MYYFDAKSTLGPLAEFEYINKTSYAVAQYSDSERSDYYTLGGEYFTGNFLIGAGYHSSNDNDASDISLGYLINDDFLIKAKAMNPVNGDPFLHYSARYNYQLDGVDYLGFTVTTDEDFDTQSYSSTYFKQLDDQRFFKGNIYYHDGEWGNTWSASAGYYFNRMTSVSAMFNKNDDYSLGVNHFFNENYSIGGGYSHNKSINGDYNIYSVSFSARF